MMFKVENLNFYWDKKNILFTDSTFNIKKERLTTIVGRNGSGKTTLLKILCNLIKPVKGDIFLNNIKIDKYKPKELAKILSYVEQDFDKNIPLKVIDILKLGTYPYLSILYNNREIIDRIDKAIELCKLKDFLQREFNKLSTGEKQKVILAKALCQSDSVILLDEPTSFLDIKNEIEIINLLRDLVTNHKYTVVMITHNINLSYQYSDEIITIFDKKIETHNKKDLLDPIILRKIYDVDIKKIEYKDSVIFYY
ncbi:MAG TPA: ABC transporter ATP-binding protein [Spirochaetota bacterium]|nr:ABC transporter ATP-binding protein [Spirochaetota bacterium]HOL56714.1 ABC transporter ATP-binding protein [Spirochaetota bacterium]